MAMKRKDTRELVVVMSGIPTSSTEWDLSCKYRDKGLTGIGSHYVILGDGDVLKTRPDDEHGNVDPQFNRNGVFIELMGITGNDITEAQEAALSGVLSVLDDRYPGAQELNLTL